MIFRVPWFIALKYFLSPANHSVVNFITTIAAVGMLFSVTAMVVVGSVFEGLEHFTVSRLDDFHTDITFSKSEGSYFQFDQNFERKVLGISGVLRCVPVLEQKALLKYRTNEYIARVKGVGDHYSEVCGLEESMVSGHFFGDKSTASEEVVLGQAISSSLSLGIHDKFAPLQIFIPRKGITYATRPDDMYRKGFAYPSGIFNISEYNDKYIFTRIDFLRDLMQLPPESVSSVDIRLDPEVDPQQIKGQFSKILGSDFDLKTRREQQDFFFKLINSENLVSYVIFTLIMCVAAFNVISAITMLIIDKKNQVRTLYFLGLRVSQIKWLFFFEGILISYSGGILGVLLGVALCYLQSHYEIITLGNLDFAYPVAVTWDGVVLVVLIFMLLGAFFSFLSVQRISKKWLHISDVRDQ